MKDVFISHAEADKTFVRRLADNLRQQGLTVWVDEYLTPGKDWAWAIEEALDQSRNVLVVLSENSVRSEWVRAEAALALTQGEKRVVPVFLAKGVEVPFMLRSIQGVDLSDPVSYPASIQRLADQLRESEKPQEGEFGAALGARFRITQLKHLALEQEKLLLERAVRVRNRPLHIVVLSLPISLIVFGILSAVLAASEVANRVAPTTYALIFGFLGVAGTLGAIFVASLIERRLRGDAEADK